MVEPELEHKEGPPWKIVRRFSSFSAADDYRNELLIETDDLQAKVRWARLRDDFVVKVRTDPALEAQRLLEERRELKKRRKKNLQKKRRKK
jgi:hypothetical protein